MQYSTVRIVTAEEISAVRSVQTLGTLKKLLCGGANPPQGKGDGEESTGASSERTCGR
jgi:hypothetical protein